MERRRKIIFTVINDLVSDRRMIRICSSLNANGYDILLVGRTLKNSVPLKKTSYKQRRLNCFFQAGKLFYLEYNLRLFWLLLFTKSDIICSIDLDTLLPGFAVSKLKGKILVHDAHEWFSEVPEVQNRAKVKRFWLGVEKWIYPKLKHAYTVGQEIANQFNLLFKTDFKVIRNAPVWDGRVSLVYETKSISKILLYQGALNEGRGLEQMIIAMHRIEGVEFHIIGEGDLSSVLRELVSKEGLDKKVKFLGFILPENLSEYTKKAWLGLNVSKNAGKSYYYSLNNKFFDYIHAGLPSLINNFPEYIKLNNEFDVGILTECDSTDLAEKINMLLNDVVKYQKLRENCFIAARSLCWQNEEIKLLEFYARI